MVGQHSHEEGSDGGCAVDIDQGLAVGVRRKTYGHCGWDLVKTGHLVVAIERIDRQIPGYCLALSKVSHGCEAGGVHSLGQLRFRHISKSHINRQSPEQQHNREAYRYQENHLPALVLPAPIATAEFHPLASLSVVCHVV